MDRPTVFAAGLSIGFGLGFLAFYFYRRMHSSQENLEEWEVVEDARGNLKKIIVHRRVRNE